MPNQNNDTPAAVLPIYLEPGTSLAVGALIEIMGQDKMILLADLMGEVISSTGYGKLSIIMADGKAQRMKIEKSF